MPPRYTYWTIILDGAPTAFRAADRETLLPTLHQIKARNPDAVLKWFARGRVWDSPEDARAAAAERRPRLESRGRDWRPGGQHQDPRERFKKETFQARKRREKKATALAQEPRTGGRDKPAHPGGRAPAARRAFSPPRPAAPARPQPPPEPREPTESRGAGGAAPPHETRRPRLRGRR